MSELLNTKRLIWGVVFAIVTAVALLSHFAARRYLAAVKAVEETMAVESAIDGSLSLLKDAETGERGYIITGDEPFLEPYQVEQAGIGPYLASLDELTRADAAQATEFAALVRLVAEEHAFIDTTIQARRGGDSSGALARISSGHGKQIMDAIRATCRQMREREEERLVARKRDARAAEVVAAWGVAFGSLVTIALAFFSLLTVHRDVEELKRTAEELARSEEHFRLLAEHGSDLLRLLDLRGKTTYVSPSVERLLGYGVEEFQALPAFALVHPDDVERSRQFLVDVSNGLRPAGVLTYRIRHKLGEYRFFEVRWTVRRDDSGRVTDVHTAARDVTERKLAEEQLKAQALELRSLSLRDELTGLYNRRGFLEVAGQARSVAARDGRPAALVFVDVNEMKKINDELGHEIGDQALADAARVLSLAHKESDVVARLGGDEFVVFSLDFMAGDLEPLRRRLRKLADVEAARLLRPYRLSMSVGAAFADAGSRESLSELLDRADAAMYNQKNARKAAGGLSLAPSGGS
jgi:diguanylate cyclase (GGDEF)-like protein/PAS domain S-box-containing protein